MAAVASVAAVAAVVAVVPVVQMVAVLQCDFCTKMYKNQIKVNISRTMTDIVLFLTSTDRELNSKLFSQ